MQWTKRAPLALAAVALVGCGSSSKTGGTGGAATTTRGNAPASTIPTSTTTGFLEPTDTQLKAALLTAADVGAPYKVQPSSGPDSGTKASGCPGLSKEINSQSQSPGETNEEVDFQASDTGPYLTEVLVAEPEAQFLSDYKQSVADLESCKSLSITSSGTTISFSLTPINFAQGASAARLDGTYQGVQLNGYLAVQRVHDAGMLFFYFQIGGGSSQEASAIYSKALDKATANLP